MRVVYHPGTVQSTSAAVNSLLSTCGVVYFCLFFILFFTFHSAFCFCFFLHICQHLHLSQFLQKTKDIFYWASFLFFFFFTLVGKCALWFCY